MLGGCAQRIITIMMKAMRRGKEKKKEEDGGLHSVNGCLYFRISRQGLAGLDCWSLAGEYEAPGRERRTSIEEGVQRPGRRGKGFTNG